MKRLIVLIWLIMYAVTTNAQDIIVIEASSCASRYYDKDTNKWGEWSDWTDVSEILIKVDTKTSMLRISNKFGDSFKLLSIDEETKGTDPNDGDKWEEVMYSAVDKDAKDCYVSVRLYDSGVFHVYCYYPNISYVYQGRQITF